VRPARHRERWNFHRIPPNSEHFIGLQSIDRTAEIENKLRGDSMRVICVFICATIALGSPAFSQGKPQPRPLTPPPVDAASDEQAAELREAIKRGQTRQRATDERNTRIWRRWDFAVCIGCGPMPKNFRIVYTTPSRVLAGFIAADDDERQLGHRI
jgi:hypothetical protein